ALRGRARLLRMQGGLVCQVRRSALRGLEPLRALLGGVARRSFGGAALHGFYGAPLALRRLAGGLPRGTAVGAVAMPRQAFADRGLHPSAPEQDLCRGASPCA